MQHATKSLANCVDITTVIKMNNQSFSVLAWHGFY